MIDQPVRITIIGRGLIGSAAARHLAEAGHAVTLVGPLEGTTPGSHWDEGRITRKNATDPFWSEVSTRAIARYRELEAASGVRFFTETGAMMAGPAGDDFFRCALSTSSRHRDASQHLTFPVLRQRFPFFRFVAGTEALYEQQEAGHISPRALVAAQTHLAEKSGARLVPAAATGFHMTASVTTVTTTQGEIEGDQILVATGGLTDHLLPGPLGLRVYARTVALLEVSEDQAIRLKEMPSLVFRQPDEAEPYLLPPIRYPDGRIYLKIGGDPVDHLLTTRAEIHDWFATDGNPRVRDHLEVLVRRLMPELEIRSVSSAACMTTFSHSGKPIIGRLGPRLTVATAGNGAGAKCSDELGRLAACALLDQPDSLLSETGVPS
ncbi:NAD(P)/FAD-dependent oxidoreductase [Algicella marina]|uniref:FAD-dependent oxidoreductase n=1 Tax=Algicella marina TaxID=2683284 RepID=A0A6P1T1L1_9RHOB|nr:FAD-dependent oxidoreductase [Algicella marina]QHQ35533.1 FAD-dependent oxidoreductase [Algicella marina]